MLVTNNNQLAQKKTENMKDRRHEKEDKEQIEQ